MSRDKVILDYLTQQIRTISPETCHWSRACDRFAVATVGGEHECDHRYDHAASVVQQQSQFGRLAPGGSANAEADQFDRYPLNLEGAASSLELPNLK